MSKYYLLIFCILVYAELGFSAIRQKGTNVTVSTPKKIKKLYPNGTTYDILDPDFCLNVPTPPSWPGLFPHPDNCFQFIWCWEDGYQVEDECEYPLYFDIFEGFCDERDMVTCWEDLDDDDWDDEDDWDPDNECPPFDNGDLVFLPSYENCEWYYICINGAPWPMECAPGLHWNDNTNRCENPRTAGCVVSKLFKI